MATTPDVEIWDPRTQPKWLTLFDDPEGAPSLLAFCEARMDGEFYVPKLTLPTLAFYWGQCMAHDPNGEWLNTVPFWRGGGETLRMVLPWAGLGGETEYLPLNPNPLYSQASNSAVFAVDGLPWRDGEPQRGKTHLTPILLPNGGVI